MSEQLIDKSFYFSAVPSLFLLCLPAYLLNCPLAHFLVRFGTNIAYVCMDLHAGRFGELWTTTAL